MRKEITFRELTKIFLQYLKENNAYDKYKRAVRTQQRCYIKGWYNHINPLTISAIATPSILSNRPNELINFSFNWYRTPEGHNYWSDLDARWRILMYNYILR
jgi:hypothetical protein